MLLQGEQNLCGSAIVGQEECLCGSAIVKRGLLLRQKGTVTGVSCRQGQRGECVDGTSADLDVFFLICFDT